MRDRVAELGRELDERREQVRVRVAVDRLGRRVQRHRAPCRAAASVCETSNTETARKHRAPRLLRRRLSACRMRSSLRAAADAHRGEDPDRALALSDAAVQLEERPEAGDVGRVRALHGDQELVAERVARRPLVARTRTQRCQPSELSSAARRLLEPVAVGSAALGALVVGQLASAHCVTILGLTIGSDGSRTGRDRRGLQRRPPVGAGATRRPGPRRSGTAPLRVGAPSPVAVWLGHGAGCQLVSALGVRARLALQRALQLDVWTPAAPSWSHAQMPCAPLPCASAAAPSRVACSSAARGRARSAGRRTRRARGRRARRRSWRRRRTSTAMPRRPRTSP